MRVNCCPRDISRSCARCPLISERGAGSWHEETVQEPEYSVAGQLSFQNEKHLVGQRTVLWVGLILTQCGSSEGLT
jgi:hypothetical protein